MTPPTGRPPPTERLIGGRYRLRAALGSGSMGAVWSAYDEVLHRPVAVKEVRLPSGMPEEETAALRERTLREARAIAALSHPNVITVYDVAQVGSAPFVVMELISGCSLSALLDTRGKLEGTQAASVADAMAAALAAAHRAGITHRDVKPGNVLVGEHGEVKLTDFGIARNVSDSTMTHTGIILGSPAFIAPEIAAGQTATPSADLWSLGATLFAAVEGYPPYDMNGEVLATLQEVVHGEVPVATTAGPLQPLISGLMRKDPGKRISLAEARQLVYWLLPEPDAVVFDPADLAAAALAQQAAPPPVPSTPPARPSHPPQPKQDAPLSSDPGPLPFLPSTAPRRKPKARRRLARALLIITSVVLFALAAGGGFAASRVLAGRPLTPPPQAETTISPPPTNTLGPMETISGNAATLTGAQGGQYQVKVPRGWVSFTEQRRFAGSIPGTIVHYVSPDGQQEIAVQWLPNFYRHANIREYQSVLRKTWPRGDLTVQQFHSTPSLPGANSREPSYQTMYRTVENAKKGSGATDLGRTTFADLFPYGDDLWVVSVTVPTDQEDSGHTKLFEQVAPSFRPVAQ
ncbi:MAG: serine/threonine-protein kinase [Sciscionella sp.]